MNLGFERSAGLYAFVRTVEAGSFSGAARIAGTTPSAVSKSVERLERRLNTKLFLRSTRALTLTPDGIAYFERVAPLLRQLEEADEVVLGAGRLQGRLRVSLPGVCEPFLIDVLTREFLPRYPDIRLEVNVTDRHIDLIREGFDIALRVGDVGDGEWIARPLGRLPLTLVASPDYIAHHGAPRAIDELKAARHVRYLLKGRPFPIIFGDGETLTTDGVLDTDSGQTLRTSALNGVGIAQILRLSVTADLRTGNLVEIMPERPLRAIPFQALHIFGRLLPLRARVLIDFISESLALHIRSG